MAKILNFARASLLVLLAAHLTIASTTAKSPVTLTTNMTGCAAVTNVIWKIENFVFVQYSQELSEEINLQFISGEDPECQAKWMLRFTQWSRWTDYVPTLILLDIIGDGSKVGVTVNSIVLRNDGSRYSDSVDSATLVQDQEVHLGHGFKGKRSKSFYSALLGENDTFSIQVILETKLITGFTDSIPLNKVIMQKFHETSLVRLQSQQSGLYNDSTSSDLTIIGDDNVVVYAHSLILQAQASGMLSKLRSECENPTDKNDTIRISDVSGNAMGILIRYVYTGQLLETWMDKDIVFEFMYAASKYELKEILEMLDETVGKLDVPGNTTALLSLATKLDLKKAEFQLVKRVVKKFNEANNSADLLAIYADVSSVQPNNTCS